MKALEKLIANNKNGKFVCVGLDSDLKKIPKFLQDDKDAVFKFNSAIIEATKDYAAAYKINFAFYEENGSRGFSQLERTIDLLPKHTLNIADAKRGDIGNTSEMYARSVYEHFGFDSITLNPYMGKDSLQPFLDYHDKLNFILVLTSNPGANDFEKVKLESGKFLYQEILERINDWNQNKNCGIVFGATKIDELKSNILNFGNLSILLPGVGAQGGSMSEVKKVFNDNKRENYIVNVSRSIIYKSSNEDFAEAARNEIVSLHQT